MKLKLFLPVNIHKLQALSIVQFMSGVYQSRVSHHSPIFNIINSPSISKSDPTSKIPRYDFCETNLDKLRNEFSVKFSESMFDYRSEESFGNFVDIINGSIEGNCKVDDKLISKSKRNKLYNLWITNGIICSIKKKTVYYKNKVVESKDLIDTK